MASLTRPILMVGTPQAVPDIRYATGLTAPDPVVCLRHGRRTYLVVPALEYERARRVAAGCMVLAADRLPGPCAWRQHPAGWTLALLRHLRLSAVWAHPDLPLALARRLERGRLRVRLAAGPVFPQRQVKTQRELALIAACQRAAAQAMRAAVRCLAAARPDARGRLRAGGRLLTAERLRALINQVLLARGCQGPGTIVAGGRQAADPHALGQGPLRAGTGIVLDIFPQHLVHGYWGDLTRTLVWGRPPPRLLAMHRAVRAAQAAARAAARPGANAARVHAAAVRQLAARGFADGQAPGATEGFIHATGHGVGLAIHEPPRLGRRPVRLRRGQVVTIEPGLYYRDVGGVRIEDLGVITARGWRPLARCPEYFRVGRR